MPSQDADRVSQQDASVLKGEQATALTITQWWWALLVWLALSRSERRRYIRLYMHKLQMPKGEEVRP